MLASKANTLDCPYVARKCSADKCAAWEQKPGTEEGRCIRLRVDALHGEFLAMATNPGPKLSRV